MKVWFFGSYDQANGESNRTHLYASYLASHSDLEVSFFCNSFCHFTKKHKRNPSGISLAENIDGVNVYWLKTPAYQNNGLLRVVNMVFNFFSLIFHGLFLRRGPDIIVGTSVPITSAFAALLISKIRRAKFVYEIRDLWPEALVSLGGLKRKSLTFKLMKWMEKKIFKTADMVITALPAVEAYARASGLKNKSQVIWIPNPAMRSDQFKSTNYLSKYEGFNIVYIGGFGRFHDIDVILRAAKILMDKEYDGINIHLFGDGEYYNFYKARANLEALSNIYFHGRIPKDNIQGVQKEAHVLLATIPNADIFKYGTNANKIINYMISKKPILYSGPCAYFSPVAVSGGGLCVDAGDADSLAEKIIVLQSSDYNLIEQFYGEKSEAYFNVNFDLQVLGKRYHDALISLS